MVITAEYNNDILKLGEKLDYPEGKKLKILVFDTELSSNQTSFFDFIKKKRFTLPVDYKFDREQMNER